MKLYASLVGEGAATEFIAHEEVAVSMPDPDDCINKPKETRVPENPSAMYAIAIALAGHSKIENFGNILTYMERLPAEYTTLCILEARKVHPEVEETEAFTQWGLNNTETLLGI